MPLRLRHMAIQFLLIIGGLLGVCQGVSAAVYNGNCGANGNNLTWSLNTYTGVLTISGSGDMEHYTSSPQPWASYISYINSVVLPEGITSIGIRAFKNHTALSSINLPSTLTNIGLEAFRATALTSVEIPSGMQWINYWTFKDCASLTTVRLPASITSLPTPGAFCGCTSLQYVYVSWETASQIPTCSNTSNFFHDLTTKPTLYVPCGTISLYQNKGWNNKFTITDILASGTCGSNLTWSLNTCGTLTISGSGAMADFTASTTGYDGDGTNAPWNDYRSSITKVVLPYGLTKIGVYAFYYCTHLTDIDIPASVTSIGDKAFAGCTSLKQVCIPEGVTTIGSYLFFCLTSNTSSLQRLYLPSTLTSMGTHVVYKCGNLRDFTIPASISGWSGNMRYNRGPKENVYVSWTENIPACPLANEIVPNPRATLHVPYGKTSQYNTKQWYKSFIIVEDVDERAIDLGLSIRWASCNVGATAPEENGNFYAWGDTLTRSSFTWGTYPYSGNSTNTMSKYCTRSANGTVDNRSTLLAFDDAAYINWGETWRMPTWTEWNELITQCTWKDTTINNVSVWQVTGPNGNSIYLPKVGYKNNSSVTAGCYYWSSTLNTTNSNDQCNRALYINAADRSSAKYGLRYVGMPVRAVYRREWPSFTLTICDTTDGSTYTKAINAAASYTLTAKEDDCHQFVRWSDGNTDNPRTVTVTADATYTAEYEDAPLASGTCGSNLTWTLSCDSILTISGTGEMMNFNNNDLQWLLSRSLIRTVVIEEGVTSIGTWAFKGCTNIEHVEIPSSVTTIGERAFIWAYGLESIHIPEGVVTIEKRVFEGCNNLKNITLPNTLETIGTYCFLNCTSLREITIPNSVSEIRSNALKTCTALTDIHVSWENADAIPDWLNLTNKDPQSDITLHVPCGTGDVYAAQDGWKDYTIVANLPRVLSGICGATGNEANVTWSLDLCDSTLTISGTGAMADFVADADCPWYQYRTQIYTINIDEGVTTIGAKAFVFSRISSITIPNSVTSIGRYAFCYSNYLEEIVLPEGLISIGDHAFYYGNELKTVHIPSSVTSLGVSAFEGCWKLKDLYVEWQSSIPEWPTNFSKQYGVNLHVPCAAIDLYQDAAKWKNYTIEGEGSYNVHVETATGNTSQGTVQIIEN